jgi:hypothetical protein
VAWSRHETASATTRFPTTYDHGATIAVTSVYCLSARHNRWRGCPWHLVRRVNGEPGRSCSVPKADKYGGSAYAHADRVSVRRAVTAAGGSARGPAVAPAGGRCHEAAECYGRGWVRRPGFPVRVALAVVRPGPAGRRAGDKPDPGGRPRSHPKGAGSAATETVSPRTDRCRLDRWNRLNEAYLTARGLRPLPGWLEARHKVAGLSAIGADDARSLRRRLQRAAARRYRCWRRVSAG